MLNAVRIGHPGCEKAADSLGRLEPLANDFGAMSGNWIHIRGLARPPHAQRRHAGLGERRLRKV